MIVMRLYYLTSLLILLIHTINYSIREYQLIFEIDFWFVDWIAHINWDHIVTWWHDHIEFFRHRNIIKLVHATEWTLDENFRRCLSHRIQKRFEESIGISRRSFHEWTPFCFRQLKNASSFIIIRFYWNL